MSGKDWRSPEAYRYLTSLDAQSLAWEFLKRNPDFIEERRKLEHEERNGTLDPAEVDEFTQRWGLRFRGIDDPVSPERVFWAPRALPSIVSLTTAPADLGDPKFSLPRLALDELAACPSDYIINHHGTTLRVHVDETGVQAPAVLLPLDQLFQVRLAAAGRLWRYLTYKRR